MDERYYWRRPAGELIEHAPAACPQGHRLAGEEVLVGNIPCMCLSRTVFRQRSHRSWRCRRCDQQWIWPGRTDRPDLAVWNGSTPAPRGRRR